MLCGEPLPAHPMQPHKRTKEKGREALFLFVVVEQKPIRRYTVQKYFQRHGKKAIRYSRRVMFAHETGYLQ
jgi:hypothetical protein